jgi:hypothetical protein
MQPLQPLQPPQQDLLGQSLPRGPLVLLLQRLLCRLLDRDRRERPRGPLVLLLQRLLCRLLDRDRREAPVGPVLPPVLEPRVRLARPEDLADLLLPVRQPLP